ncbi:sensor histidine kinase [Saccharopolyspora elongata]|uniref:sensor histidine kinase n=1 Tax=Saccharopolyspora elongata TaxID=2530387 RepID=UPI001F389E15|nr:histidine kinase [Saccharopolyspora elongata]
MRTGVVKLCLPAWQQDVLIVAVSVALGALLYGTGLHPLFGVPDDPLRRWLHLALFAAICVAELFRRRAPALALIAGFLLLVGDGVLGFSMPMWIVFVDLVYAATLYGPRWLSRKMVPIAALSTPLAVLAAPAFATDWRATVIAGLTALSAVVLPVVWASNVRQHQEMAEAERVKAAQLAKIAELDRTAAVTAERTRMARDLHDVVSGHLSAIAIQSEAVLSRSDADPATVRTVLRSVRENSVRALEEMRAMIGVLRAGGEDEVTAPARLTELSALVESARAGGMRLELRSEVDDPTPIPAAVGLTAYRIIQEALTNAAKHAPDAAARLTIRQDQRALTVEVANELAPSTTEASGTGAGLLNMRERATTVGGSLSAGPAEPGWLVRAVLPISGVNS